ncbi:tyrosine-type recombinase/integrase [Mesorhizobium sp.]|uniref:tyrosine-type recombinase/integrase n=1 Tax=Mesorhizobium sp. TaxID=1871066 RepID=UPI0025BD2801|nr:tyrosine-type recombinase/integrase [Mesorhizobium sp.]
MIDLNKALAKDRWIGRLASHLDDFEALLDGQGYAKTTVQQKIKLLAGFSAWVERQDVPLSLLGEEDADRFLTELGRRPRRGDACTIRQLLRYLRDTGGVPVPLPEVDTSAKGKLIDAFGEFLRTERGLSASTLTNYLPIIRGFLDEQFGGKDPGFDHLRVGDVHRFIVRRAQAGSLGRAKLAVTALRSFLRFLQQRGLLATDLAVAVPGIAGWRLAHLPKALRAEQVERLLASCDRRTPAGRRDYAVLMLLARLGLRGGEVSALTLDDLDWDCGEIVVHGKGQRLARLPLPADVGAALVDYLRQDRPACSTRRIFIRTRAPRRGFVRPTFEANRERMAANTQPRTHAKAQEQAGGAAREGGALLQGIARCGHCGRRLHTHYRGRTVTPGYHCAGKVIVEGRGVHCLNVGGVQIVKPWWRPSWKRWSRCAWPPRSKRPSGWRTIARRPSSNGGSTWSAPSSSSTASSAAIAPSIPTIAWSPARSSRSGRGAART